MLSKVVIPESLFEALLLHAFSDEGNEIMGLLIGELKDNDEEADDEDEDNGKCHVRFETFLNDQSNHYAVKSPCKHSNQILTIPLVTLVALVILVSLFGLRIGDLV